jgi:hypothetical protein
MFLALFFRNKLQTDEHKTENLKEKGAIWVKQS